MDGMRVISPAGGAVAEQVGVAPHIDDLAGKTICEIWNGVFKGDYTFPVIRDLLKKRYPTARILPYTEFPSFWGSYDIEHQKKLAVEIAAMAKEKGCDAVISGNGA